MPSAATPSAVGSLLSLSALQQDVRFALRMFVKSPLFTTIVVTTLALGIGLNTAVFSAVEALIFRPLPGARATHELVQLYRTAPGGVNFNSNSIPHYFDLRDRTPTVFSGVAAWSFQELNITANDRPQTVMGQMVSANFFSVFGVTPARGRFFTPDEDIGRGAHPVAVLSHGAWRTMFGEDPQIVGRSLTVNGQAMTIIGVAPAAFIGAIPMAQPVLWVPLMQLAQIRPGSANDFENRGNSYLSVVARLAPGVTPSQAAARLDAVIIELEKEYPDTYRESGINLVRQDDAGIHPMFRSAQVGLSSVVMAVVGLLLIIACVNVANLFLARARDRSREMAVRLSLGARRFALVRQLLVESVLFAVVSGLVGLAVAMVAIRLANGIRLPVDVVFGPDLRLSTPVLLFAVAVSVTTGVLFGVAPALQATRPDLIPALKGEAPAGQSRSRTSRGLVVAQMALSIVLLISAALFLVNLRGATALDKGFNGDRLLIADVNPGLQGYLRAPSETFYRQLLERLRANPSVQHAALISELPLGLGNSDRGVTIPGYTPAPNEGMSIGYSRTSPGYFEAMGITLREGREFTAQDDSAAAPVVIVNQHFVDRFWRGQSGLGRMVRTGGRDFRVVGVVPTGKYLRLGEDATAFMYFPQLQMWASSMSVVVRTVGEPTSFIPQLRRDVGALDATLPLANVRTMDGHLGIALLPARVAGTALGVFGLIGLLLASVGMYGVMAYSVSQRTREIGIRMAIGATGTDVVRLVMRQGLTLVLIGTVIGLAGALAASRVLASVLYGGDALHPLTFAVVPLILIAVAALAIFVPARRASSIHPAVTLRAD